MIVSQQSKGPARLVKKIFENGVKAKGDARQYQFGGFYSNLAPEW